MKLEFHPDANSELLESANSYLALSVRLGLDFGEKFQIALDKIVSNPKAWPVYKKATRRVRLQRFPYAVIYKIRKADIFIVAVMHLHRNPKYWQYRLK